MTNSLQILAAFGEVQDQILGTAVMQFHEIFVRKILNQLFYYYY